MVAEAVLLVLHVAELPFLSDPELVEVLKWLLVYHETENPELAGRTEQQRRQFGMRACFKPAAILALKFGDPAGEKWLLEGLDLTTYTQQTSARALGRIR